MANNKFKEILELKRSKRERKETNIGDDFYTFLVDDDPKSYKGAM